MGQAETKEGKRSSLGSNQSPISPQAAHHPHDQVFFTFLLFLFTFLLFVYIFGCLFNLYFVCIKQRASTPTPSLMNSLDRTKQQRSRRASHEDTIKDGKMINIFLKKNKKLIVQYFFDPMWAKRFFYFKLISCFLSNFFFRFLDPRKTNSKPQSDFVLPVGLPGKYWNIHMMLKFYLYLPFLKEIKE